jgi:hypothetical protein
MGAVGAASEALFLQDELVAPRETQAVGDAIVHDDDLFMSLKKFWRPKRGPGSSAAELAGSWADFLALESVTNSFSAKSAWCGRHRHSSVL